MARKTFQGTNFQKAGPNQSHGLQVAPVVQSPIHGKGLAPDSGQCLGHHEVFLLDAAALLNNESFSFAGGQKYFTSPQIFSEWKDFRSRLLAENAAKSGALEIRGPSEASLAKCAGECGRAGAVLSNADASIVALAIDFMASGNAFVVITDDYSVQNALKGLGIKFIGVAQGEIKKARKFGAMRLE